MRKYKLDQGEQGDEALVKSETRYRRLFETAQDGILILDGDSGEITDVNPSLVKMLGYSDHEFLGKKLWEIDPLKNIKASRLAVEQLQTKDYLRYDDLPLETRDGKPRYVEFISNVYMVDGSRVIQCNVRDITSRIRAEELLGLSEERFRRIFEAGPLGMAIVGRDYRLLNVNTRLCQMLGYTRQELLALTFEDITHPEDIKEDLSMAEKLFRGEIQGYTLTKRYLKKNRDILWIILTTSVVRDSKDKALYAIKMVEDITSRKEAEERLIQLTTEDALTGLFNRRHFEKEMVRLERGRRYPVSIVMADVDHLKLVNDRNGHAAGDKLLKRLARVLTTAFRTEDVVARIGGDEFAILLPETSSEAAEKILKRVQQMLQVQNAANPDLPLQLSCGLSTAEKRTSLVEVLKEADARMYLEKQKHAGSSSLLGK